VTAGPPTEDALVVIADGREDLIITGGENVSCRIEVETASTSTPPSPRAAGSASPTRKWRDHQGAGGVRPAPRRAAADLIAFCRTRMAHYKCPNLDRSWRDPRSPHRHRKLQKFKLRSPTGRRDRKGELTGRRGAPPLPHPHRPHWADISVIGCGRRSRRSDRRGAPRPTRTSRAPRGDKT